MGEGINVQPFVDIAVAGFTIGVLANVVGAFTRPFKRKKPRRWGSFR